MTTLTFRGSQFTYQPTRIHTPTCKTHTTKYRGQVVAIRQPITPDSTPKGLIYRGVAY
ncbi:hypothetical protein Lepto7376_3671 [[Leptolyngbya] sp. PCC 7376]|uniref:DUF4278 domain-containing protein n=1 Tax=[Leptolyngbya] sp. PCC 7376 TaxID=111781 RepID=UPI00029F2C5A|nr:DUF4278 domain-containing protein [[Leptolyngbya] sp. PCC 7376]AFY39847.1 hypothetical protein Lepto7376_3671 [[Leptolyngbya] sp. PCC 7376]